MQVASSVQVFQPNEIPVPNVVNWFCRVPARWKSIKSLDVPIVIVIFVRVCGDLLLMR